MISEQEKLKQRFEDLTTALQYDSYGEKKLTDFDRMFIAKERSAVINGFRYAVPPDVEQKIQDILYIVKRLQWEKPI